MACHLKSLIFDCLNFTEGLITSLSTTHRGLLPLAEGLLPLFCHPLLPSEEVSDPKTINIKQYLNKQFPSK